MMDVKALDNGVLETLGWMSGTIGGMAGRPGIGGGKAGRIGN